MNTQGFEGEAVPIDSSDSDRLVEKTHGHWLVVEIVSERHRVPHGSRPLIQRLFGYLIEALPHAGKVSPVTHGRGAKTALLRESKNAIRELELTHIEVSANNFDRRGKVETIGADLGALAHVTAQDLRGSLTRLGVGE